jgi:uncharacterized protein YpmB
MKKFLVTIVVIMVICLIYGVITYNQIMNNKTKGYSEAILRAKNVVNISNVIDESTFSRKKSYVVVHGYNKRKDEIYAFVPKKGDIFTVEASKGISKENAIKLTKERYSVKKLMSAQIGIEDTSPLWEVKYIDSKDRIAYCYLNFETGEHWANYAFS